MKRTLAVILALIFVTAAFSACSVNININKPTEAQESTEAATEAVAETTAATEAPAIGTVDDYVKTAKENTVSYSDGNTNTLRIPEILVDSADAKAANKEIESQFGFVFDSGDSYQGVYYLDYEAYLNNSVLSVVVLSKYDGGNTYGLAYNFDVLTGDKLDNKQVCEAAGESYEEILSDLREDAEEYYKDKYGAIQGNDAEREKTFSDDNLNKAVMYLDGSGDIVALVDMYAAVGGGHWVVQLDL